MDAKAADAWEGLIRTVGYLLKTFESELEESEDLQLTWYDVLIQLYGAPGERLRMQALADKVVLSRSGLTRLIDRMEKAGLVRREASREDRRGYNAIMTEEGRRLFLRARPIHQSGIYQHFTGLLDDTDVQALRTIVSKIRKGNRFPSAGGP